MEQMPSFGRCYSVQRTLHPETKQKTKTIQSIQLHDNKNERTKSNEMSITIKMHAPSRMAFNSTAKSMGKLMLNESASVNISRTNPDHCFVMLPIWMPSIEQI